MYSTGSKGFSIFKISILIVAFMLIVAACGSSPDNDGSTSGGSTDAVYDGTVVFGNAQWDSIEIHTAIARTILEKGYGIDTSVQSASSAAVLLGLERGDIDILMEAWRLSYAGALDAALETGRIQVASINFADDTQGIYVPRYVIEGDAERGIDPIAPDLRSVLDLPEYKDIFVDPTDASKGIIMGAPVDYIAAETLAKKMDAYELHDTFNYFTPGSITALVTDLDTAFRNGEPWVGYHWTPTYFAVKYDLVLLEEPEYTEECWQTHMGCAFPSDEITIPVNTQFAKEAPEVMAFISNYKTSAAITDEMLLYFGDNEATPEETAIWWLQNNDLWTEWVPAEIADKVKEAL